MAQGPNGSRLLAKIMTCYLTSISYSSVSQEKDGKISHLHQHFNHLLKNL